MDYRKYTRRNLNRSFLERFFSNLSVVGWLIFINFVFFFIVTIIMIFNPDFINYIALKPADIFLGKNVWTLITHMFMHAPGGLLPFLSFHLLINMFVLFSLGNLMEKIIGSKRFFWFYLISGIFAGLLFVILSGLYGNTNWGERIFGSPDIMAVGASGAIFAIAGLFVMILPKLRFSIIFLPFFSLPAYIMVPLVLFLTWLASSSAGLPIGNVSHFGGFLAGLIYGLYLRKKYKHKVKMLGKIFGGY